MERVGIDDNFFALGGDSIVSIRLVSLARKAGLLISPRSVFQHQTVSALAEVAASAEKTVSSAPDVATGELPATPIMRWLEERGGSVDRYSQAVLLQVPADLGEDRFVAALQAVLDHHDALRLRLMASNEERSDWRLEVAPVGTVKAAACTRRIDISKLDDAARHNCIAEQAEAAEARLAPASGVMVQAVWFDAGAQRPGRLLLTIHHLAVDGVSWRILLPDLAAAWEAGADGQAFALPPRGTSFRQWAQLLTDRAQDPHVTGELAFWTGTLSQPSLSLDDAATRQIQDGTSATRHLTLTLPAAVTGPLLTRVPAAFHGGVNDVLLTGLVLALADWGRRHGSGSRAVLLDLEGHGREDIGAETDLSRTVGWFTTMFPVRLDPGTLDLDEAFAGGAALGRAFKSIKEQLHAVPGNGLGYGLLRYLNVQTASSLAGFAPPQLGFNYLGRFPVSADADWTISHDTEWLRGNAATSLAHRVDINAMTLDTDDGATFTATWSWASAVMTEELGSRNCDPLVPGPGSAGPSCGAARRP